MADDGDRAVLPYLEWRVVQTGPDEVTLSNDDQPIPILVTAIATVEGEAVRLTFRQKEAALAAPVLHRLLRAAQCFAKPCRVQAVRLDTGRVFVEARKDAGDEAAVDPEWVRAVADLAAVQERTGHVIIIPTGRGLTDDERLVIARLRHLLRNPVIEETWHDLTASWPAREAGAMLEMLQTRTSPELILEREEEVELFGARIPLGIVRHAIADARLVNADEIRTRLAAGLADDTQIRFRFAPGARNAVVLHHLAWGAPTDR